MIDPLGNKWFGTGAGLVKYDGTNWTVYNSSNSGLPNNTIKSIKIDSTGNKWLGTYGGGLVKFDDTHWSVFSTSNSNLPDNYIVSVSIDGSGTKWIGTLYGGLAKYDDKSWTIYNRSNSGLPENYVSSILIDSNGRKWIGTNGGLAVFKEGGVVSINADKTDNAPSQFTLFQNYPNPFNPTTNIQYSVVTTQYVSLKVYDVLGNEVATLVNEEKQPGSYQVSFNTQQTTNNRQLSSGVYFYQLRASNFVQTRKMIVLK